MDLDLELDLGLHTRREKDGKDRQERKKHQN